MMYFRVGERREMLNETTRDRHSKEIEVMYLRWFAEAVNSGGGHAAVLTYCCYCTVCLLRTAMT